MTTLHAAAPAAYDRVIRLPSSEPQPVSSRLSDLLTGDTQRLYHRPDQRLARTPDADAEPSDGARAIPVEPVTGQP